MGARRELVKGMLLGIVVGAAVTIAIFQLRGGKADLSAAPKPKDEYAEKMEQLDRERRQLLAELAAAKASGREDEIADHGGAYPSHKEPDAEHGASESDDWWKKLSPNPAWDDAREALVIERLGRLGVKLDAKQVECKRRCCRIEISDEDYTVDRVTDIGTSLGLDLEPPDGYVVTNAGSVYRVTKCWMLARAEGGKP